MRTGRLRAATKWQAHDSGSDMPADGWKRAARALRLLGYLIGTLLALAYLFLLWLAPPPDWQHMRPKTFMIGYVGFPLGMIFGTAWLFGWIAGRIDRKPPLEP